jgi:hypothetical protein
MAFAGTTTFSHWKFEAIVFRTGASTQRISTHTFYHAGSTDVSSYIETTGAASNAGANAIQLYASNSGANAMTGNFFLVEFLPYG